MTVTIRDIKESDKAQWTELWNKFLEFYASIGANSSIVTEQVTETTFSRFLDPAEPVWSLVAEDDETHKLVGFANYLFFRHIAGSGDLLCLNDLFVDETRRLAGTGRKLIERVYEIADEKKISLVAWASRDNNDIAKPFLQRLDPKTTLLNTKDPVKITN